MINLNSKCILKMVFIGFLTWGNSWSQWRKTSLSAEEVTAIGAIRGAILAGTRNQGIFSSSNNGANWTTRNLGLPVANNSIISITTSTSGVFAGTDLSGIFRSTDDGTTWTPVNHGLPEDAAIPSIVIRDAEIYASALSFGVRGVFQSMDNGKSWSPSTPELYGNCWVWSLAFDGSDIYAAVDHSGIYQLKDKGINWDAINVGLKGNCCFSSLLINENTIYVGSNDSGMFVSTNNGASWSTANKGLTIKHINALASFGPVVFAGMWESGKVFYSCNKGKRWAPLDTGSIRSWGINSLAVIGTTLYAGTYGSGLMQLSLDSIPGALFASHKSHLIYKIPVSGDTLNYGYTLLDAPIDMSVSPGGTIAWTPKNDSSYITQVDYLVIDDNGKRDTSSILVFVNRAAQTGNKQISLKTTNQPAISIIQNPGSRNCTINLSGTFCKSDIYIYNLAGRIIDKLAGNNGTSILWQPRSIVQGSYILLVKNGAEQLTKQFVIR